MRIASLLVLAQSDGVEGHPPRSCLDWAIAWPTPAKGQGVGKAAGLPQFRNSGWGPSASEADIQRDFQGLEWDFQGFLILLNAPKLQEYLFVTQSGGCCECLLSYRLQSSGPDPHPGPSSRVSVTGASPGPRGDRRKPVAASAQRL